MMCLTVLGAHCERLALLVGTEQMSKPKAPVLPTRFPKNDPLVSLEVELDVGNNNGPHIIPKIGVCDHLVSHSTNISKLFASHGDSGDYHLNEYEALVAFVAKENVARVAKGAEPWVLENLPSYKGSRMHIMLELAEAIVRNRPIYLAYLSTVRVCSNENKLVQVVWEVLSQLPVRL